MRRFINVGEYLGFVSRVAQLGLIVLALSRFRIEDSQGFQHLLPLIFFGFIIHHLLPKRYRRAFFLALSLAGIMLVLPFPHSVVLIAMALGLVGLCHLPISLRARVGLILLTGVTLAAVRAGWLTTPTLDAFQQVILPVLAAMFMFRLAIYLYDLSHDEVPATLSERLSYFFLLPNVSFLLFPVLDYQTYRRCYYDGEPLAIYQKGLLWMVRGLVHLLIYRLVYQYFVPSPHEVNDLTTVTQYMVTSYLLYLRISGQFHLIAGILCLFGFNIPETHHLYYLSSGVNDFWRRINIYWKDFMMKMIYYPAFVPLNKRFGMAGGIAIATIIVFLGTWILHSYQWFWLRNSFPLAANDFLFWGFLGLMVVINSLIEARGRKHRPSAVGFTGALTRSAKIVGFFAIMCVLWSFWSSASPGEWLAIVARAGNSGPLEFVQLAGTLAIAIAIGAMLQMVMQSRPRELISERPWLMRSSALQVACLASLLVILTLPYVRVVAGPEAGRLMGSLRRDGLNTKDQELVARGYYEGLLDQRHAAAGLVTPVSAPRDWVEISDSEIAKPRDDLLWYELKPSYTGTFKRAAFSTNRWGMRDRDYELAKPPGTYRIALSGASYDMGSGVANGQDYGSVLEDLLNSAKPGDGYSRFEVLNFAVGGYSMLEQAVIAETKIIPFKPDMLLVSVYSSEHVRLLTHVTHAVANNVAIPYPELRDIIDRAGATPWLGSSWIRERLRPYANDLLGWAFRKLKADADKQGTKLLVLFLPETTDKGNNAAKEQVDRLYAVAVASGLQTVKFDGLYDNYKTSDISVTTWDPHPSVLGHRLVADRLYQHLVGQEFRTPSRKASAR
jgi:D-alanyl-lipoteichoic acid acyltransferase DltB (MBOAT superfamily)